MDSFKHMASSFVTVSCLIGDCCEAISGRANQRRSQTQRVCVSKPKGCELASYPGNVDGKELNPNGVSSKKLVHKMRHRHGVEARGILKQRDDLSCTLRVEAHRDILPEFLEQQRNAFA